VSKAGDITLGGTNLETRLTYAAGRVKGSATLPTAQGPQTVTVDTALAPGTLDESMVSALVPTLAWGEGVRRTVTVYVPSAGRMFDATLAVAGKERVAVPAGNFDAWKITYTGTPQGLTFWVTTTEPHRTLRMAIDGQPVSLELVK
jgi:hypothetical protein